MAAILSHLTALHILIIGVNTTLSGRIKTFGGKCYLYGKFNPSKNLAENIIFTVKHEDGNRAEPIQALFGPSWWLW